MSADRFLRARDVVKLVGLSETTLWRMGKAGEFPAPLRITQKRKAWSERAILEWMEGRSNAPLARNKPPSGRQLVRNPDEFSASAPATSIEAEITEAVRRIFALPQMLQAKVNNLDDDEWLAVRILRRCIETDTSTFNGREMQRRMPLPKPSARAFDAACGVLTAAGVVEVALSRDGAPGRPRKDFRLLPRSWA